MPTHYKLEEARQAFSAFMNDDLATPVNPNSEISRPYAYKPKAEALRLFLARDDNKQFLDCATDLEEDCGDEMKHFDQDKWDAEVSRGQNH